MTLLSRVGLVSAQHEFRHSVCTACGVHHLSRLCGVITIQVACCKTSQGWVFCPPRLDEGCVRLLGCIICEDYVGAPMCRLWSNTHSDCCPHGCQRVPDLTAVWGCNQGGSHGLTRNLGGSVAARLRAPPPASHRWGATMGQDGFHEGVAVSKGLLGSMLPCPHLDFCTPLCPS